MADFISTQDNKPVWVDLCFCADCKRSELDEERNKPAPYFCKLWNEHMKPDDFCSRGKED